MNLIYIDESGNTGLNLKDQQQPVFLIAALIALCKTWFPLEEAFYGIRSEFFNTSAREVELHIPDLKQRRKAFETLTGPQSLALRDRMLQLIVDFKVPVIYRRIIKQRFAQFCESNYGPGIQVDPYIMGLPFVCMEVDHYLKSRNPSELGMLIFDEQKTYARKVEKSLQTLRLDPGSRLKTTNIIEKGFFVDSSKCFAIQLADLAAHYARKYEEDKAGFRVSDFDKQTFARIRAITSTGIGSSLLDILDWVKENHGR